MTIDDTKEVYTAFLSHRRKFLLVDGNVCFISSLTGRLLSSAWDGILNDYLMEKANGPVDC